MNELTLVRQFDLFVGAVVFLWTIVMILAGSRFIGNGDRDSFISWLVLSLVGCAVGAMAVLSTVMVLFGK